MLGSNYSTTIGSDVCHVMCNISLYLTHVKVIQRLTATVQQMSANVLKMVRHGVIIPIER